MGRKKSLSIVLHSCLVIAVLILVPGCGFKTGETPVPTERVSLSYADLQGGFKPESPLDYTALARPDEAAAPLQAFEGRMEFLGEAENGNVTYLRGEDGATQTTGH